jgi:hypothetical protein
MLKEICPDTLAQLGQKHNLQLRPDTTCTQFEMYLKDTESVFQISPETQADIFLAPVQTELKQNLDSAKAEFAEVLQDSLVPSVSIAEPVDSDTADSPELTESGQELTEADILESKAFPEVAATVEAELPTETIIDIDNTNEA